MRAALRPWRALSSCSTRSGRTSSLHETAGARRAVPARQLSTTPAFRSTAIGTQNTGQVQPFLSKKPSHEPATIHEPTIYALSTAPGRAAIAIIRISGSLALPIYTRLCQTSKPMKPRYASVRTLYDPSSSNSVLDSDALVLYFPSPLTATGEDLLELHVHGGLATVRAVLAAIPSCAPSDAPPGAIRYAEAGEFTRRAFLNGRLDLTQVEALGDVLAATTEQQRKLYVRGSSSQLGKRYEGWRRQLLYARGELEALIDFSEDQHFDQSPGLLTASVADQVRALKGLVQMHGANAVRGELLRSGIAVSLLGAPNAGKSSLLNRVVGREAAIVSQEAGTTRDVVEVGVDLGGYFVRLGDTAGLRRARGGMVVEGAEAQEFKRDIIGKIEEEGMRRAKERAMESDSVIVVLSFEPAEKGEYALHCDQEVVETAAALSQSKGNVIIVVNKTDQKPASLTLAQAREQVMSAISGLTSDQIHFISCKAASESQDESDAGGIQAFLAGLLSKFREMTSPLSAEGSGEEDPSIWQESLGASERHRILLDECQTHLDNFLQEVEVAPESDGDEIDVVLAAESLRAAANCLARITGKGEAGDVEEVLGVVFEK